MGVKKYYDNFVRNFIADDATTESDSSFEHDLIGSGDKGETPINLSSKEQILTHEFVGGDNHMVDTEDNLSGSGRDGATIVSSTLQSPDQHDDGPEVAGSGDAELRGDIILALKEVFDPEIPLNIYDLGLIYRIDVDSDKNASIDMSLSSPNCPVAGSLPGEVETAARSAQGVGEVAVEVVWDPPWDMNRMGEAAKLELGLL